MTVIPKGNRLNVLPANPEEQEGGAVSLGRFPSWLHRKLPEGVNVQATNLVMESNRLHTVCEEAKCPNLLECWSKKTATFLAMGKACTRNCGFCDIDFTKKPATLDVDEPKRIASSVEQLGLSHVVITMVARDDLEDGGALHLSAIVAEIRAKVPKVTIELLTSDFNGNFSALDIILKSSPEVFNHNIETTRALTPSVRHTATYDRSMKILKYAKSKSGNKKMLLKSGMMLGLGESKEEVEETLCDLASAGCDIVTMGQYLQPGRRKLLVKSFVSPEDFKKYEIYGHSIGIKHMYCGPLVRSSYNASLFLNQK